MGNQCTVGLSIGGTFDIELSDEAVDELERGETNPEHWPQEVGEYWEQMSVSEKVEALNLADSDGHDAVENAMFVDDENGVLAEW